MINELIRECDIDLAGEPAPVEAVLAGDRARAGPGDHLPAGRAPCREADRAALAAAAASRRVPVLGITGTGGSGKSSLTDELVRRLRIDQEDKLRVAVLAVDPTRRRGGGALLGDRIRMNSLDGDHVYFRSLATRGARELPDGIGAIIGACQAAGYDLVIVETPGIGQGDAAVVPLADVSLYVMTPEFGAASQLEKIDMLDFADVVAINKFERRGADDALRDVSRQLVRNREAFGARPEDMPVFGTSAAASTTTASPRCTSTWPGCSPTRACRWPRACCPRPAAGRRRTRPRSSRRPGPATWPRSPRPSAATTPRPPGRPRRCGACSGSPPSGLSSTERAPPASRGRPTCEQAEASMSSRRRAPGRSVDQAGPTVVAGLSGDEQVVRIRDRELQHPADPGVAVREHDPAGGAAALRRPRRAGAVPARGEPARALPVHRRGVPVQAGRRGPGPDVRRRGRPVPHQPALPPAVGRAAGDPAVDRVRLGHPVRPRPGRAPRHLRQGRHVRACPSPRWTT